MACQSHLATCVLVCVGVGGCVLVWVCNKTRPPLITRSPPTT